jgi:glycosyltransferase involved in cell wall biosynthesis
MRVCVVQPIVPRYRVPVFASLAKETGIDLEVWADLRRPQGSLRGVAASDEFRLVHASSRSVAGVSIQPAAVRAVLAGFDVVVLGDNVRQVALWAALAVRRSAVVVWGHGFGTSMPRAGDFLRRLVVRQADAALFYSDRGRDRFRAMGLPSEKLFVAPNAIDQTPISAAAVRCTDAARASALRSVGLEGRRVILFLSRLEREKRPELAIECLRVLRGRNPDLALAFIGDGSQRAALESLAREAGVADSVRFLGAIHDEDRIAPWATSARLLIHPGALGLTVLHAFGYGLPVVTTDDKGIQMPESDCLIDGVNGLEFEGNSLTGLVAKCDLLLSDPALRGAMSRAALESIRGARGHNLASMVSGMVAACRHAIAVHRR